MKKSYLDAFLSVCTHGGHVALRAGPGGSGGRPALLPLDPDGLFGHTLRRRGPVIVDDARREKRFDIPRLLAEESVVSGISAVVDGPVLAHGLLAAFPRHRRSFTRRGLPAGGGPRAGLEPARPVGGAGAAAA